MKKTDKGLTRLVFAKRQDDNTLACFVFNQLGEMIAVEVIVGWTAEGYIILQSFKNLWDWLKYVIDDIREWQENNE